MNEKQHTQAHKRLDEQFNTLLADFFEQSGIPPHKATIRDLLFWSDKQAKGVEHPCPEGAHAPDSDYPIVFPPLPTLPEYDQGESYSRDLMKRYAQHVAKIMIDHAKKTMIPVRAMDSFPPPPALTDE